MKIIGFQNSIFPIRIAQVISNRYTGQKNDQKTVEYQEKQPLIPNPSPVGGRNVSIPSPFGRGQGEGNTENPTDQQPKSMNFSLFPDRPSDIAEYREKQPLIPNPSPDGGRNVSIPSPFGRGQGEGSVQDGNNMINEINQSPYRVRLSEETLRRARELRKNCTDAEQFLWQILRDRQLNGLKFRRQHPFNGYFLDFYCLEKKLAIEIDGSGHAEDQQQNYDQVRTDALKKEGITVLRFWNNEVFENPEGVLETILDTAFSIKGSNMHEDDRSPLQDLFLRQWKENAAESNGGNYWNPPEWVTIETDGCPLPPFKWNESRRAVLRAELDAYYAALYGLNRKQLRYILDPADLTAGELKNILDPSEEVTDPLDPEGYAERTAASDFPGETFRVLKKNEIQEFGEYRTRRLVLEAWERLSANGELPEPAYERNESSPSRQEHLAPTDKAAVPTPARKSANPTTDFAARAKDNSGSPHQIPLSDFGLYKCTVCNKMVMGFEKENHEREKHGGKKVEWKKMSQ